MIALRALDLGSPPNGSSFHRSFELYDSFHRSLELYDRAPQHGSFSRQSHPLHHPHHRSILGALPPWPLTPCPSPSASKAKSYSWPNVGFFSSPFLDVARLSVNEHSQILPISSPNLQPPPRVFPAAAAGETSLSLISASSDRYSFTSTRIKALTLLWSH